MKLMVKNTETHPLRHIRKNVLNLTLEAMADAIGCSSVYLSLIERNEKRLNEELIQKIWQVYGIPPNDVLGIRSDSDIIAAEMAALTDTERAAVRSLIDVLKSKRGS